MDATMKPSELYFSLAVIQELQKFKNWVVWERETKKPYRTNHTLAKVNDSATWTTLEDALEARDLRMPGLGFVFSADAPFCGIDLDYCLDPMTGELDPWAEEIFNLFPTAYAEISPSGLGVKLFVRGKYPTVGSASGGKYPTNKGDTIKPSQRLIDSIELFGKTKKKEPQIEIYNERRYFTLTGEVFRGQDEIGASDCSDIVSALKDKLDGDYGKSGGSEKVDTSFDNDIWAGKGTAWDVENVRQCLNAIDGKYIIDYFDWSYVGMACHYVSDDCLPLWDEWSKQNKIKYEPEMCRKKWASYSRDKVSKYTFASLVHWAGECTPGFMLTDRPRDTSVADSNGKAPTASAAAIAATAPYPLTDLGNAKRFIDQHGQNLLYAVEAHKWLIWTGNVWEEDKCFQAMQWFSDSVKGVLGELSTTSSKKDRGDAIAWLKASGMVARLEGGVAVAKALPGVPVSLSAFDSNPWLLNVTNGTINLKNGKLLPHTRQDRNMKIAPVAYAGTKNARGKHWGKFLDQIFVGDKELEAYVQRIVGSALVGEVYENILPVLYGHGRNGKSTFVEALLSVLGEYAIATPEGFLMASKGDKHPTELMRLKGARFVAASETEEGKQISEAMLKRLTSADTIVARAMRQDFIEFEPTHTILLSTNHKPVIKGGGKGLWRRLRLIPFNLELDEADEDHELKNKLLAEKEVLLSWAMAGCLAWQAEGIGNCSAVLEATKEYEAEEDIIGNFLTDRTKKAAGGKIRALDLYREYVAWCELVGQRAVSLTRFGLNIKTRTEIEKGRDRKGRYYGEIEFLKS